MENTYCIIICTVPDEETASKIAEKLLIEKLAACCNIIPGIQSLYYWDGKLCKDHELLLIIKSRKNLYEKLEIKITELHPYEVPEIIEINVNRGLLNYLKWVDDNVQ